MSPINILASNNANKLREINQLLQGCSCKMVAQTDFNVPEAEETGLTFVENAILKARNAAKHTKLPAFADDSGLVVDALNGAPGIYSARYAGIKATSKDNIDKLLYELRDIPTAKRSAHFYCVMVFIKHELDPAPIITEGRWDGLILQQPQGKNGFGYDPIFFVPTHNCSAAELPPATKNQLSHRGQALAKIADSFISGNK
ncbi:MAG: RdgB/HAM1 family non-canonical purine NTP pyrophosphatase [Gammaproteobacteria bacterium]|nr:RdgB/HAM1 family non-canonical purine NTP pyrophosphatase [Gammaproteobacteria bacterium]